MSSPPSDAVRSSQPQAKKKKLGRTSVHDEYTKGRGAGRGGVETDGCHCKHCGSFFMSLNPSTLKNHLLAFHNEVYQKVIGMPIRKRLKKNIIENSILGGGSARVIFNIQFFFIFFAPNGLKIIFRH